MKLLIRAAICASRSFSCSAIVSGTAGAVGVVTVEVVLAATPDVLVVIVVFAAVCPAVREDRMNVNDAANVAEAAATERGMEVAVVRLGRRRSEDIDSSRDTNRRSAECRARQRRRSRIASLRVHIYLDGDPDPLADHSSNTIIRGCIAILRRVVRVQIPKTERPQVR